VGLVYLAVVILENPRLATLKHAQSPPFESGCVLTIFQRASTSFHSHQADCLLFQKIEEEADGVAATAHACYHLIWKSPFEIQYLFFGFCTYDSMEITNHSWIGVRAQSRAQNVMSGPNVCDPITHGFVNSFLESAVPRFHASHLGSTQTHPKYVQSLPPHVLRSHVDYTFESKTGTDRSSSDAVLAGSRLRDDTALAHFFWLAKLDQGHC
jgi:hypothetical protein